MLVYISYPELSEPSGWVSELFQQDVEGLTFLDPNHSIVQQAQNKNVFELLNRHPHRTAQEHASVFKLDNELFQSLNEVSQRIGHAESTAYLDLPFKNLYCLLRSDLLIVDMNGPEVAQDVMYAWMWNIPIIGATYKFLNSPTVQAKCDAILNPLDISNIIDFAKLLAAKKSDREAKGPGSSI